MKIAVLGTGMVGQSLTAALLARGHFVVIGTRDVATTLAAVEPDTFGAPGFALWYRRYSHVPVVRFADAIAQCDVLINATRATSILDILARVPRATFEDKVLIDVSNDLDFSRGLPPILRITDVAGSSVGERIQTAFPLARVVKTLNTMNAFVMVRPELVSGGDSTVFVSGNDVEAKKLVQVLLREFGWDDIIDLGDIATARTAELLFPLWFKTWGAIGQKPFNFKVAR
ncbi:MAG TPA: NAD(P)-binding domain-containing protein [Kofleriaceae bacterium]|nr:NAD(P)-binding domain-containing protein [Kofleriaceae bacterium]